jgi:hypothetical protein
MKQLGCHHLERTVRLTPNALDLRRSRSNLPDLARKRVGAHHSDEEVAIHFRQFATSIASIPLPMPQRLLDCCGQF